MNYEKKIYKIAVYFYFCVTNESATDCKPTS